MVDRMCGKRSETSGWSGTMVVVVEEQGAPSSDGHPESGSGIFRLSWTTRDFLFFHGYKYPTSGLISSPLVCRRLPDERSRRYNIAGADGNVCRDSDIKGHGLPCLGVDTCRNHQRTRTLRPVQEIRKGHPAETASQELETSSRPLKTLIQHALTEWLREGRGKSDSVKTSRL